MAIRLEAFPERVNRTTDTSLNAGQQLSPGYGTYTARLFSYLLKEVVATHSITINSSSVPGLGLHKTQGLQPFPDVLCSHHKL
jgi:hypothetical protein